MFFVAIILGLVVGIGVMVVLYKPIFGDWEGFKEALLREEWIFLMLFIF